MSVRYHINPETGRANICRAKIKCNFAVNGVEPTHYQTKEEAVKSAEKGLDKEYNGPTKTLKKNRSKTFKNKRQAAINKEKKQKEDPTVQRENELNKIAAESNGWKEDKRNHFITQHHYQKEIKALQDRELNAYANTLSKEELFKLSHGYTTLDEKSRITNKKLNEDFFKHAANRKESNEAMKAYNQEKEEFYSNPQPMNSYQNALAKVIVNSGDFFQPKAVMVGQGVFSSWGDTRGKGDYQAQSHFKECGVAGFNDLEEDASWELYDTFNSEDHVGIKAEISCNCQKCFKSQVFMEGNAGDLLKKLATS